MQSKTMLSKTLSLLVVGLLAAGALSAAAGLASVSLDPGAIRFAPQGDFESVRLVVSGPDGLVIRRSIAAGDVGAIEVVDLADGEYAYELRPVVVLPEEVAAVAAAARDAGDARTLMALRASGDLPRLDAQSGTFRVAAGAVVSDIGAEPVTRNAPAGGENVLNTLDQVINDDLIVTQSACIGQDCVNGESFGFDTLRLKENNLRIKFQDTSNSASFPTNDWQLTANDSTNGGANKFSIDDIDGGRTPFTIEASAPSNSLFVEDGGRIGFGTSTPVVNLHLVEGNTPTLRLEQDGSNGFTPQTWDVAGNEAGFFVRDATNGSLLSLRIRPSAPASSIDIAASGNVGVGTSSPDAPMHIRRTNSTAQLHIQNAAGTTGGADLLLLENPGTTRMRMIDTVSGNNYQMRVGVDGINLTEDGTGGNEFEILVGGTVRMGPGTVNNFILDTAGNLTILGMLMSSSDRDVKHEIDPVDQADILQRVSQLPLATWKYKKDDTQALHLGPMAQDFSALFGLGIDDKTIAPQDMAGVALAAIQELNQRLSSKNSELQELESRNEDLEGRVEALSQTVEELLRRLDSAPE